MSEPNVGSWVELCTHSHENVLLMLSGEAFQRNEGNAFWRALAVFGFKEGAIPPVRARI